MGMSSENEGQGTVMGTGRRGELETMWWRKHVTMVTWWWGILKPTDGGNRGLALCMQQGDGC